MAAMMTNPRATSASILLFLLLGPLATSITSQKDSFTEYCYKESTDLGTCLGRQQQYFHLDLTLEQIEQCLECSGNFQGNESCQELKDLNIVSDGDNADVGGADGGGDAGFCQTYNECVETNCPQECWREQDLWLDCLVVELDCDWRCPSSNALVVGIPQNSALRLGRGLWTALLIICGSGVVAWGSLF